jgi:hypothetical protein
MLLEVHEKESLIINQIAIILIIFNVIYLVKPLKDMDSNVFIFIFWLSVINIKH